MPFANPSLLGALGAGPLGAGGLGEGGTSDTSDTVVYPIPILEVALTDPLEPGAEWVDITQWCLRCQTSYGRQHELNQVEAQTIIATMDNMGGLFSSWNFKSAFVNLLSYIDSTWAQGDVGSWVGGSASRLDVGGGIGIGSAPSLELSRDVVIANARIALTGGGVIPMTDQLVAVTPNSWYTGFASVRAKTDPTDITVSLLWFDSGGSSISSSAGMSITDQLDYFLKATVTAQAPSNAAFVQLKVSTPSPHIYNHFIIRPGITKRYVDPSGAHLDVNAWSPGGYGIHPGSQLRLRASTGGDYYPEGYGFVESSVATILDEQRKGQTISAADAFKFFAQETINSSLYPGLVLLDGACLYWRFGDPLGSLLAEDFSRSGGTGAVAPSSGGSAQFQQGGLLNQDTNASVELTQGVDIYGSLPDLTGASGFTIEFLYNSDGPTPSDSTGIPGLHLHSFLLKILRSDGLAVGEGEFWGTPTPTVTFLLNNESEGSSYSLNIWDGVTRHFTFTYDNTTGTAITYIDGVAVNTDLVSAGLISATLGHTLLLSSRNVPGDTIDELAIYPSALTASQVADHYDLSVAGFTIPGGSTTSDVMILLFLLASGFPTDIMSFEVGLSEVIVPSVTIGSTPVISVVNQIVATEQGLLYMDQAGDFVFLNRHYAIQAIVATTIQATFENSEDSPFLYLPSGFQPTTDDADLWNDIPTQNQGAGALFVAQDLDSIRHGGRRTLQGYTSMLNVDDGATQDLGMFLLGAYSTPYARIRSITISSAARAGQSLSQMLERDLLDLIGVIYHPQDGGDAFDQAAQIERIQHDVTPRKWMTTWQLNPYVFGGNFWLTFDDAFLGRLAGAGSDAANRFAY